MDKENILERSRNENVDEAVESFSMRGLQNGYYFASLLFGLFYVSCAIRGKEVIWREALLAMYMAFFGSIGYTLYKFTKKRFFLVQFILGGVISLILSLATLYWIWIK